MKSDPVRSVVRISTSGGDAVSAAADMMGVAGVRPGDGDCASAATAGVAMAAAPASDARFRKPRRFMEPPISRVPSSRQTERDQLSAVISPADREDDVLL